jgi:hypothetical protein
VSVSGTVGGHLKLRGFSWKPGIHHFGLMTSCSDLGIARPDLPGCAPYVIEPALPIAGWCSLLRPPIAVSVSTGLLTGFPSTTPFGLALGADSPCADCRCARNPWACGVRGFHPHDRYSCQHSHFRYLQRALQHAFIGLRNAPLPCSCEQPQLRYVA